MAYAVPDLRGGGGSGEAWHEAGMFGRKQNVFDDFSPVLNGCAIRLLPSRAPIAIEGGSNGDLLQLPSGAAPRPVGAVVSRSGRRHAAVSPVHRRAILDLRIRIGNDPRQFQFLYAIRRYHNVT